MRLILDGTDGRWAEQYGFATQAGRPALFLDRDGVIVEEVHFLSRVEDIQLVPGVADAIAGVNRAGIPVIQVTNQSGVGRGLFDWAAFRAVNAEINAQLAALGAHMDAVFACGDSGLDLPPSVEDTMGWRKPGAGMLLAAGDMFRPDLSRSYIAGDRVSDLKAAFNAGLAGGWLVMTGYGQEHLGRMGETFPDPSHPFSARTAPSAAEAIEAFMQTLD